MSYKSLVHRQARKELDKLPTIIQKYAEKAIDGLADNPRPNGYKKLTGYTSDRTNVKECYIIRVGDYRIIHTIEQEIITITVVQVKKRGDIY